MEDNFLCSIALFDEQTSNNFIRLKEYYCGDSCDNIPPHITLGAYVDINVNDLIEWTELFSSKQSMIDINFNHIGLFGSDVCFLAPRVDEKLLKFHYDYHQKFDDSCGEIGYNYSLQSNNWIPHSTLIMDSQEEITKTLPIFQMNFEPFAGHINKIAIYEFSPVRLIKTFNLQ